MTNLNAAQHRAVYSNSPKILCLAGAGTGKTYSLIERIIRLSKEISPDSILALTFTHAAAFEMSTRYKKQISSTVNPNFGTFHAFCYSLINNDKAVLEAIGYHKVPRILDSNWEKRLKRDVRAQLNIRVAESKLNGNVPLTPREQYDYTVYHKKLAQMMQKESGITFDTLLRKICELFVNDDAVIQRYKSQYKYIFVDEFQDTDPIQWEFVKSFKDANVFCVGDALQSIYGFTGASSKFIKELSVDPEWEVVRLTENYRSTIPIIELANELSDHADPSYRLDLVSSKDGPNVEFGHWDVSPYDRRGIDHKSVNKIISILNQSTGTSAILCRTNNEVSQVYTDLKMAGLDAQTGKKDTDPENFVKSILDPEYFIEWILSLLPKERAAQYVRLHALEPDKDPLELIQTCASNIHAAMYRIQTVQAIKYARVAPRMTTGERIKKICELIGYPDLEIVYPDPQGRKLGELLLEAVNQRTESTIYVGTVHSSKGLEYDNVFLCGPGGPSFPLKDEEAKNLRYVGVTRAKTNLYIFEGISA